MSTQDKNEGMTLTLVEAVETLSNIADLQFDREVGIAQQHDLVLDDKPFSYHTVHWLHHKGADVTVNMVKETFHVILNFLQNFYKNDYNHISDPLAIAGIKTIMVLVGEAAKKLDKYTTLFYKTHRESVTDLKEYKLLQEFYFNRVAKKIDEGTIGKWILALASKGAVKKGVQLSAGLKNLQTKHVFMDLESVKKDTEYELFFLRKEDGTRFFSPRLIRNIKLVSDFGSYLGEEKEEDPLLNIEAWQDKAACTCAKNIMRSVHPYMEKFSREAVHFPNKEFVELVRKSLMALMMAANARHMTHRQGSKSCRDYFHDFQSFLRRCLRATEYQKMIAYPPDKSSKQMHVLNLIHSICLGIYTQLTGYQEFLSTIHALIHRATEKLSADHKEAAKGAHKLWTKLAGDYAAMSRLMKSHASAPLNKMLRILEEGECHEFDPMMQDNLPSQLFTLYAQENSYQFARWPSPTFQELIHKAFINEEFKAFLRACGHDPKINKVLVVNFQDRVAWKEHFRCMAIEELPSYESFAKHIEVVTLAKDTEFYHQLAPFNQENHADVFMRNFKEQMADVNGGFFFSKPLRSELSKFIPGALEAVHRIFFSEKNILLREDRLNFIEIFYVFLQLKIFECLKPDHIGFSCKDGLDVTSASGAELFAFLKLMSQERLSENDQEHLDLMLYGSCLMSRDRMMIPDRFNRMLEAIKAMEQAREQCGRITFSKIIQEGFVYLFKTPILTGKLVVHSNKNTF